MVLGFLNSAGDVEHGQHAEDERLEKRHEQLQGQQKPGGKRNEQSGAWQAHDQRDRLSGEQPPDEPIEAREQKHDREQDVAAHDVAEESDREGKRARQMAEDLDHEHERGQPDDRSAQMLHVAHHALLPDANPVVGEEDNDGAGDGRVQVGRGSHQPRDEAHEV